MVKWYTIMVFNIGTWFFIKLCYNGCGFPTKGFLRLDLTSTKAPKLALVNYTMVGVGKYHLIVSN